MCIRDRFWSASCGHCIKEVPILHEVYQHYKEDGVKCMAVSTDLEREGWVEFIEKHELTDWINAIDVERHSNFRFDYHVYSTPVLYLLDEEKKIVAKRISVETLDDILALKLDKDPALEQESEEKEEEGATQEEEQEP